MYVFDLAPQLASDYQLGNWYTSTSLNVPFTTTLVMERVGRDRRYRLVNGRLIIEGRDGEPAAERVLGSAAELSEVLDGIFNVVPPAPVEELFAVIADQTRGV
jgi:N-hydroxyarylamine O-acetyltransferase